MQIVLTYMQNIEDKTLACFEGSDRYEVNMRGRVSGNQLAWMHTSTGVQV